MSQFEDDKNNYVDTAQHHETLPEFADDGKQHIRDYAQHAEDRATALKLAQLADPGPKMASAQGIKFFLMVLVVCMCGGDNGFDGVRFWFPSPFKILLTTEATIQKN